MAKDEIRAGSIAARVAAVSYSFNNSHLDNYQGGKELGSRSALRVYINTKFGRAKLLCFPCMTLC